MVAADAPFAKRTVSSRILSAPLAGPASARESVTPRKPESARREVMLLLGVRTWILLQFPGTGAHVSSAPDGVDVPARGRDPARPGGRGRRRPRRGHSTSELPARPAASSPESSSAERATALSVDASDSRRRPRRGLPPLGADSRAARAREFPRRFSGLRPEVAELLAAYPAPAEVDLRRAAGREQPAGIEAWALAPESRPTRASSSSSSERSPRPSLEAARKPRRMRWAEVGRVFESAGVDAFPVVTFVGFLAGSSSPSRRRSR